jgi:hypothetical protein
MWNYFRVVAVIWGLAALLTKPVLFNLLGDHWRGYLKSTAYKQGQRPAWIIPTAVFSFVLIGYTWYLVYLDAIKYDWVLALLMTTSLVKIITLLFDYPKFQGWVSDLLSDPAKEKKMILQVTIAGIVLIVLGFTVY